MKAKSLNEYHIKAYWETHQTYMKYRGQPSCQWRAPLHQEMLFMSTGGLQRYDGSQILSIGVSSQIPLVWPTKADDLVESHFIGFTHIQEHTFLPEYLVNIINPSGDPDFKPEENIRDVRAYRQCNCIFAFSITFNDSYTPLGIPMDQEDSDRYRGIYD